MASVASTVSTNIVPVQGQFDANGNCLGLIGPGGVAFFPPLAGDSLSNVTINNSTIGVTTPAAGSFTNLNVTNSSSINGKLIMSSTAPTIASGFGGNATITATSTASFKVLPVATTAPTSGSPITCGAT